METSTFDLTQSSKDLFKRIESANELLSHLHHLNLTQSQPTFSQPILKGAGRLSDNPTSVATSISTLAKKSQIVAIDLGVMASSAAYFDSDHGPTLISQGSGNSKHLRNMIWSEGEQIKVGSEAAELRRSDPQSVIHSIQRWIGQESIPRPFCGKDSVPPEVVLAALLRQLLANSASSVENSHNAIVTIPSTYDQLHRIAIETSCRIAGIDLVQLIEKPIAATISWLDVNRRLMPAASEKKTKIAYIHLGGSGLEVSILESDDLLVRQRGVGGHWKLGSLRWQNLLTEYFVHALHSKTGKSIRNDALAATRLQRSVELAMDRLTRNSKVAVKFEWQGAVVEQTMTQAGLVKIAPDLCKGISRSIDRALQTAGLRATEIDQILLSGSMMQMEPVRRLVLAEFPVATPSSLLEKSDVAKGAAIQAHYLTCLTTGQDTDALRGVSCVPYDFALLPTAGGNKPVTVLGQGIELPASITKRLRTSPTDGPDQDAIRLLENAGLGENNWRQLE